MPASPGGKTRTILLIVLVALFVACIGFLWSTRGVMANLSFVRQRNGSFALAKNKKSVVDVSTWQTAKDLAALAVTAEEMDYARDAERLADHEVDQAFAAALRQNALNASNRKLTGDALAISQKIDQLKQLIAQDQAQIQTLTAAAKASASKSAATAPAVDNTDLEVAKAQLGLDTDELSDAQRDLERATGDNSAQIQEELAAEQQSTKETEAATAGAGQVATVSARQNIALAGRINAWLNQLDRYKSLLQAQQKAQQDAIALTAQHDALEKQLNGAGAGSANSDQATRLASLKTRSADRQILSIYDDRIQTNQQLASVYGKWAAQVLAQHAIVLHLILRSVAVILFILIAMLACDALVRRLMQHPKLDGRQSQTLRSILELSIQLIGAVLILLVIFGTPKETPTIIGLATAALTVALQDFILAFLGWFVLVGKHGIRVGDWVEINGVAGEVSEVKLFNTTLLETGTLEDKGHPTGRRITFMNSFAIRGQYFNFSTASQWMWDEITLTVPSSENTTTIVERIHQAVLEETQENARLAEKEWKRSTHPRGLSRFSAAPVVNLRPGASGFGIEVRYITRASERFELRNRLYRRVVELLQQNQQPASIDKPTAATV